MGTLYSTMACPYAHRAMLALELRPVRHLCHDSTSITTANQLSVVDRIGLSPGDTLGMLGMHAGKTADIMHARKEAFKRDVNPTGEVPSLLLASGSVVCESEIVCEYLDATSDSDSPRLMPAEPLAAARVRMAMKRFNEVPGALVALLKNQDVARATSGHGHGLVETSLLRNIALQWRVETSLAAAVDSALSKFLVGIDKDAHFCFEGGACTLADVHAAPFVYRFNIVLAHYRGYHLTSRHPRLGRLLRAMEALPQWSAVLDPPDQVYPPITERSLIGLYAAYANNNSWANGADGPTLAGRGVSHGLSSGMTSTSATATTKPGETCKRQRAE